MEGGSNKRKREEEGDKTRLEAVARESKRQATSDSESNSEFAWHENTLPLELVESILLDGQHPGQIVLSLQTFLSLVVCRRVCKWWRDMLPLPASLNAKKKEEREKQNNQGRKKNQYGERKKKRRTKLLFTSAAAREGHMTLLRWGIENGCHVEYFTFREAARAQNVEILKWLWERYEGLCREGRNMGLLLRATEKGGSLELFKWLYNQPKRRDPPLPIGSYAATKGHLDVIKCLPVEHRVGCKSLLATNAGRGGHVAILEFLFQNDVDESEHDRERQHNLFLAACGAAHGGRLPALKWLVEVGGCSKLKKAMMKTAAEEGHLEIVKYLMSKGCPKCRVAPSAASLGNIEIIKWATENDETLDTYVICRNAVKRGHIHVLKWLKEEGHSIAVDANLCTRAAKRGNLEMLKWLREEVNCPWEDYTFRIAAKKNRPNFEVLNYLRESRCPLEDDVWEEVRLPTLEWAFENGLVNMDAMQKLVLYTSEKDILQWAIKKGCKLDARLCLRTVKRENWSMLSMLINNGCPVNTKVCAKLVRKKNLPGLKILMKKRKQGEEEEEGGGKLLDESVFREAAAKGYFDALVWLREQGCPWDESVCRAAAENSEREAVEWLVQSGCPMDDETLEIARQVC